MNRAHRVTFGPGAFLLGAVVTVLLFGVPLGATGYVFGIAAALLLGMPLALATGVVMRPVRDQVQDGRDAVLEPDDRAEAGERVIGQQCAESDSGRLGSLGPGQLGGQRRQSGRDMLRLREGDAFDRDLTCAAARFQPRLSW